MLPWTPRTGVPAVGGRGSCDTVTEVDFLQSREVWDHTEPLLGDRGRRMERNTKLGPKRRTRKLTFNTGHAFCDERVHFRVTKIQWGVVKVHVQVLVLKIHLCDLGLHECWHFLDALGDWMRELPGTGNGRTVAVHTELEPLIDVTCLWIGRELSQGDREMVDEVCLGDDIDSSLKSETL